MGTVESSERPHGGSTEGPLLYQVCRRWAVRNINALSGSPGGAFFVGGKTRWQSEAVSAMPPALSMLPEGNAARKSTSGSLQKNAGSNTTPCAAGSRRTRWEEKITKKRGAQPGNKNAKGNPGGGAPVGNSNAEKEGAYSAIFYENLSPAEKQIVENAPTNSTALTSHEIGILLLREKYILDKISEYRALPPDTMITFSVMDMRVPGGNGKQKQDGGKQQIGMYNKETPDQRITQLQEALNKIHGRILTAAAQMQKNEMDALRLELEKQRLEIMRMRATGEISDGKEDDEDDAVHE